MEVVVVFSTSIAVASQRAHGLIWDYLNQHSVLEMKIEKVEEVIADGRFSHSPPSQ